jgi:kynurenine formamidase
MANLSALTNDSYRFFAVPVKVKKFGTFPVRAFALE